MKNSTWQFLSQVHGKSFREKGSRLGRNWHLLCPCSAPQCSVLYLFSLLLIPQNLSTKEKIFIFANGETEAQRGKIICFQSHNYDGFVRPQSLWIRLCLITPSPALALGRGSHLCLSFSFSGWPPGQALGVVVRGKERSSLAASYFSRGSSEYTCDWGRVTQPLRGSILSSVKLRSDYPSQRVVKTN